MLQVVCIPFKSYTKFALTFVCPDELKKRHIDVAPSRIAALLELSLRTSAADADPFKDDLKFILPPPILQFKLLPRLLHCRCNFLPLSLAKQLTRIMEVSHDTHVCTVVFFFVFFFVFLVFLFFFVFFLSKFTV